MAHRVDICSLDYLAGTLATAYKGLITSLVIKDFCMTEEDSTVVLKGTILSMPQGDYTASFMHGGAEISRVDIRDGYFELKADSRLVKNADELRIDIIQNGRHIGTFLLKRERPDAFFSSALELSRDLEGVNLKSLTASLGNHPGLLRSAESIVSQIMSVKKDWEKLADEIFSFSRELFWFARDAYSRWFAVLSRYALKAAERAESADRDRPVFHFISLLELPLSEERDAGRMRMLADVWLDSIRGSSVRLSYRFNQALRVIRGIHGRAPDADVRPALRILIGSLRETAEKTPALDESVAGMLEGAVAGGDLELLGRFGESGRGAALRDIAGAGRMAEQEEYAGVFEALERAHAGLWDDADMMDSFFSVIDRNMAAPSAERLVAAVYAMLPVFNRLSPNAYRRAMTGMAGVIQKLSGLNMIEICSSLMVRIGQEKGLSKENIILNQRVASSILRTGNHELMNRYTAILKQIVIPAPHIRGFSSETWAEVANPLHLERLSKFLDIIRLDTVAFRDVLIHVVCNLHISGVFIPDDKLFQREVSAYLNADTFRADYLLNYMLLKQLPVYFNEIGATGRIRDYSTEIDSWGNDTVLYFLRKQTHVNASNNNIRLLEAIIAAWVYDDPGLLEGAVPDDVLAKLDRGLMARYTAAMRPLLEHLGALDREGLHLDKVLAVPGPSLERAAGALDAPDEIKAKAVLICKLYREITGKYAALGNGDGADSGERDAYARLSFLIDAMRGLKRTITSPEMTSPVESLFFKRHIAFGIPSVLGTYHEAKFDAFGGTLRREEEARVIFEGIIGKIGTLPIFDIKNGKCPYFSRWIDYLDAAHDLFELHGLPNFQVDELLVTLRSSTLYASQLVDMLRIWQRELTWEVERLYRTFHAPLTGVLKIFPEDELPERLGRLGSGEAFINKAADIVMRDIISGIPGFTELDRMLNSLIAALHRRGEESPGGPAISAEVPGADYFVLGDLSDLDAMKRAPLLGSKAKGLVYLGHKGLAVPHGVTFSAAMTRDYQAYTGSARFGAELERAVEYLEERTGASFAGGKVPLFLSVRSGSYLSMPGILSSVLYCGMNARKAQDLAEVTGNAWLAWDSYRRFVEHYGTVVGGLDIGIFEELSDGFVRSLGLAGREELDAERMKGLVGLYLNELKLRGRGIPDDVYGQLQEAVKAVYGSWYGGKAVQFRKAMDISGQWGTSVTLMQMIYGNDRGAGASVFFTRKPFSYEKGVYGETRERSTGDDLVYGRYANRPLAREQALGSQKSLEETDPELFLLHEELAQEIEKAMGGLPQEVEATYITNPDGSRTIYVLQTRRMEFHRGFTRRFHDICSAQLDIIGRGIGVHGGAISGIATLSSSAERIRQLRSTSDLPVILLRTMTSTDDVSLMPEIDGLVTSVGGATSHAAILAQKFDLSAVVGCSALHIGSDAGGEAYARIGEHEVRDGSYISVDGSTGLVYSGLCMVTVETETY